MMHNCYDLNPPATVIIEPQQSNPVEDYFEEIIAEHNENESYENQHIIDFDYVDRLYFSELIKYEPKQTV